MIGIEDILDLFQDGSCLSVPVEGHVGPNTIGPGIVCALIQKSLAGLAVKLLHPSGLSRITAVKRQIKLNMTARTLMYGLNVNSDV